MSENGKEKEMNQVCLIGRLARDPKIVHKDDLCIASYTLAVDRRGKDAGTDWISIKAFGKRGEFAEAYLHQGQKIAVSGRIQTGQYKDKDGKTIYTTDVVAENQEFVESKKAQEENMKERGKEEKEDTDGWLNAIESGLEDELPFA